MDGVHGTPEIRFRPEPFDLQLTTTPLPTDAGRIIEFSPVVDGGLSTWLLLADDGRIARLDADSGECRRLVRVSLMLEPDHELTAFAGPGGTFFSDGQSLFSSDESGLSRWDVNDGCRTGYIAGFSPTFHHRGANELVQIVDNALLRWRFA